MIIPQENISTFISKNDGQNSLYKLHVPTNVFFEMVKKEITYEFVGFRVARFDSATNTVVDEKKFNGTRDTSFFKAVDYFEELIEKNSPKEEQQKQDDFDSVGLFVYFKEGKGATAKIPIEKVVLNIAEASYPDETPIEFKDFLEASKYIKDNLELTNVGYDKHSFTSTWTDGETWQERLDISEIENNPNEYVNILGSYFLSQLVFYLALAEKGGTTFGTPEETKERALNMLEEYKKYDFQIQVADSLKIITDRKSALVKGGWAVERFNIEPFTEKEFHAMIGKYFVYDNVLDPYIDISNEIITIPYQDIDKVFTPPQTKKFGRLDMTVLDDPKYDVVRSKFALKYNEEKSKEIAEQKGLEIRDVWAYEMQPYSNGTPEEEDEGGGTPPPDVNDNQLNQNDIEGEEPNQREPKEGEKGEKGEKSEKGESSENSEEGEKSESGEEEDEDLGWDEDKNGEPKEEEGSESEDQNQKSENGNEDTGNPPPSDEDGESSGQGEPSDEQGGKPVDGYNMDLIEALNRKFQTDDILSAYKTLKNFMSALRLKGEQIRELAPLVGLNTTATKGEILREIEQQITPFYQ